MGDYNSIHDFEQNITLNDIMADTKFVGDQREIVLGAIRMLQPDFVPVYKPPATYYENVLMNQLNEHLRPLSERLDPNVSIVFRMLNVVNWSDNVFNCNAADGTSGRQRDHRIKARIQC